MNKKELKKYIQEKIGQGVSKLDVLKELFQKEEKKSKRKFIKYILLNYPSLELLKNKKYLFFKWLILFYLAIIIIINLLSINFLNILLISIFTYYIWKNYFVAYYALAFFEFLIIFNKIALVIYWSKIGGLWFYLFILMVILSIVTILWPFILYFKYIRKDNKEIKKYLKENKI